MVGGRPHLRVKHLQKFLRDSYPSETRDNPIHVGYQDHPTELEWTVLVLVPKENAESWGLGY